MLRMTDLFWIPRSGSGRLGIMPRPRGNDWLQEEVDSLSKEGVDVWISALTLAEREELGLEHQSDFCKQSNMDFRSFPIFDRSLPAEQKFSQLVDDIRSLLEAGQSVVVHCRLGIGRAGMITTGVLIAEGETAQSAIRKVSKARRLTIPDTDEQREFLFKFEKRRRSGL